jgi:hypothetical protein
MSYAFPDFDQPDVPMPVIVHRPDIAVAATADGSDETERASDKAADAISKQSAEPVDKADAAADEIKALFLEAAIFDEKPVDFRPQTDATVTDRSGHINGAAPAVDEMTTLLLEAVASEGAETKSLASIDAAAKHGMNGVNGAGAPAGQGTSLRADPDAIADQWGELVDSAEKAADEIRALLREVDAVGEERGDTVIEPAPVNDELTAFLKDAVAIAEEMPSRLGGNNSIAKDATDLVELTGTAVDAGTRPADDPVTVAGDGMPVPVGEVAAAAGEMMDPIRQADTSIADTTIDEGWVLVDLSATAVEEDAPRAEAVEIASEEWTDLLDDDDVAAGETGVSIDTYTLAVGGSSEFNRRLAEITVINTFAALDYAHKLLRTRSMMDFFELSIAFAQRQLETVVGQTKEAAAAPGRTARGGAQDRRRPGIKVSGPRRQSRRAPRSRAGG